MDATLLGCNSCHDNHGKLRRLSNGTIATTGAPIIGSGSYTNSAATGSRPGSRRVSSPSRTWLHRWFRRQDLHRSIQRSVASHLQQDRGSHARRPIAYGAGISDWCATCHPDMHSATSSKLTHPVNQGFSAAVAANYNAYLGSGMTGASGFDTIVPFQTDNTTDYGRSPDSGHQHRQLHRPSNVKQGYVPFLPQGACNRLRDHDQMEECRRVHRC